MSCQDEYSLVVRDHEQHLIPAMQKYQLGLLPYFPLACGLLTGKYKRNIAPAQGTRLAAMQQRADQYLTERNFGIVEKLTSFAEDRGHSILELAFSWLAARPTVASVIAGATKPEQVQQNVDAAGWTLTADEIAEIDRISA